MDALKILEAVLSAAAPITAIVAQRVYPLELPPAKPVVLPAIVTSQVSDDGLPTLDAAATYQMRTAVVETHLITKSIAELDTLRLAVCAACDFQRGTHAGFAVSSMSPGRIGMPENDSTIGVCYLPITFTLIYRR